MATILHSALTGPEAHEPKGADTAAAGSVYVADGTGSGTWQTPTLPSEVDVVPRVQAVEDSLSEFKVQAPTTPWVEGFYLNISDGQPTSGASSYGYGFWAVEGGEIVKLSGKVAGGSTALAYWYDTNDSYLGHSETAPSGAAEIYDDFQIEVPTGATRIGMCQQTSFNTANPSTVKAADFSTDVAPRISAVEAALSQLEGLTDYWSGKSVVWFGNSIPTGNSTGGVYPELVAAELGFTLHQETTGGMAYRAGIQGNVTGGDPLGWTGMSWTNLAWSLGASAAEKQDLIDNWATWQPLLSNSPPATLTSGQKQTMLDTSYTNRLIDRHLGGNRKDWYIFDNPFNDRNNADDLTTAGDDGGEDRTTYLGTMNFLIRLILQDNPQAKIAFVGHYENQLSNRGLTIVPAQQMVADRWSYPLLPLWEKLGWSQETITVNGSWASSGGGYDWTPGTGTQTLTMLNRALADGVHPASDNSGDAVQHSSALITSWMKDLR